MARPSHKRHPGPWTAEGVRAGPCAAAKPGRTRTADRGGVIQKVALRWVAVMGLAVLGGCAGGASGAKSPPELEGASDRACPRQPRRPRIRRWRCPAPRLVRRRRRHCSVPRALGSPAAPPGRSSDRPGGSRPPHRPADAGRPPDRSQLRQRGHRGRHPGGERDRGVQLHDRPGRRREEGHDPDLGPHPGGRGLQRPPGRARGQRRDGRSLGQSLQDPADDGGARAPAAHRHRSPARPHPARRRGDHPDRAAPVRAGGSRRGDAAAVRAGRQPRGPGQSPDRHRHRRQRGPHPPDPGRARRGGRDRRSPADPGPVRRRRGAGADAERVLQRPARPHRVEPGAGAHRRPLAPAGPRRPPACPERPIRGIAPL